MISRTTLILTLVFASLTTWGQGIDSVSLDLKRLTGLDFFKKYCPLNHGTTKQEIKVIKLLWSLGQVREIHNSLRQKGIQTCTVVEQRPTDKNPYYIIAHYQSVKEDDSARLSYYRVDPSRKTIDYQDRDDFVKEKWKRIK